MKIKDKPKIAKRKALEIAKKHNNEPRELKVYKITDTLPDNPVIEYSGFKNCWYILCAYEKPLGLHSSRLICVSKATGKILFDGSAGDEG